MLQQLLKEALIHAWDGYGAPCIVPFIPSVIIWLYRHHHRADMLTAIKSYSWASAVGILLLVIYCLISAHLSIMTKEREKRTDGNEDQAKQRLKKMRAVFKALSDEGKAGIQEEEFNPIQWQEKSNRAIAKMIGSRHATTFTLDDFFATVFTKDEEKLSMLIRRRCDQLDGWITDKKAAELNEFDIDDPELK